MKSGEDTSTRYPMLTVLDGRDKGQRLPVTREPVRIGRSPHCNLHLNDSQVSRTHATVRRTGQEFELSDMDSRNGTRLNGRSVSRGILRDGDLIRVGDTTIRFSANVQRVPVPIDEQNPEDTQTILLDASELAAGWAPSPLRDLKSQERAKADLEALYRVGRMVASTLDITLLLHQLMDLLFEEIEKVERCSIHLIDEKTNELVCREFRSFRPGRRQDAQTFSERIIKQVLKERKAVLYINESEAEQVPAPRVSDPTIVRSAISAPLVSQDHIIGLINADTSMPNQRLNQQDLRLLAAIGFQAGSAIENARLYAELSEEKIALQEAHEKLKQAHMQLVQSEKMAAIGQLASGVVHDLKTPMMVIVGYADMLRRKLDTLSIEDASRKQLNEYLDYIAQGVGHSDDVVKNLLLFSRPSKPERVPTDLNELLDETVAFLQPEFRRGGVVVNQERGDNLPKVLIDPSQVKQVFINILINAVQAMERRNHLKISTGQKSREGKEGVVVRFVDTGQGMSPEQLAQVFAPFYTTKLAHADGKEGTGLGLSVSYRIIESHGGLLEAESTLGEGSIFTVWLPVEEEGQPEEGVGD